ncbi:SidA protein, substrate of the Dot/Icm transport system [Legionella rubrilucens]|uniref:SidA protein, substrate of the Dot/Icm transport system n=1 Tax=Legionella rubrilucens TaxID=458 RepID=A0A0W0XXG3_9GAMM|nr:T4SS effector SidA family protein [Legionella rubrilucens]KTD48947.1 SidA protein, substrate of the Dot/Icm transport system [Legionella rubrilucens]
MGRKTILLSERMKALKYRIRQAERETSLVDEINKRGNYANNALGLFSQIQGFFASIFSQSKQLPIIGFILQMVSVIPTAITTLFAKDKTVGEKLFAMGVLVVVTALSIAAFVLTAAVSAAIGVAVSALTTVLEGISLAGSIAAKLTTRAEYKQKKEFNQLLEARNTTALADEKYLDPLRVRYLELQQALRDPDLKEEDKNNHQTESTFIHDLLTQRGLTLEGDEESQAGKLKKCYDQRWEKMLALTVLVENLEKVADSMTPDERKTRIAAIDALKEEIVKLDTEITGITKPIHQLKRNDLLANEKLAQTYTTFALAGAGVVLSTIALLMAVSVVAAPPVLLPIVGGLAIAMATIGLIKWVAEKFAEKQDSKADKKRQVLKEESILDESLDCYQTQLGERPNQSATCSYSNHMLGILQTPPDPQPPQTPSLTSQPTPPVPDASLVTQSTQTVELTTLPPDANPNDAGKDAIYPSAGSNRISV